MSNSRNFWKSSNHWQNLESNSRSVCTLYSWTIQKIPISFEYIIFLGLLNAKIKKHISTINGYSFLEYMKTIFALDSETVQNCFDILYVVG